MDQSLGKETWGEKFFNRLPKHNFSQKTVRRISNLMVLLTVIFLNAPLIVHYYRAYIINETDIISWYSYLYQILISIISMIYAYVAKDTLTMLASILSLIAISIIFIIERMFLKN